ncbi:MAG: hypothetical protein D6815_02570, partial [Candidatus Dadabacteria bacterium]
MAAPGHRQIVRVKLIARLVAGAFVVAFALATAHAARAYDAELAWSGVPGAQSYNVYVRYDDAPYTFPLGISGTAGPDGVVRGIVRGLRMGPTASFAVTSIDADGVESEKSNELSIDYATAARTVDSDGDGLTDAQEDKNLNQVVDPGETDPSAADTDGDGIEDGAEINAGTDPTDPTSGGAPACGNGIVEAGEQCDDGPANSDTQPGACRTDCTLPSVCGDADADNQLSVAD